MSCSNRKYENPDTKKFQDLQEIINEAYVQITEMQRELISAKDAYYELRKHLREREDEINSISLRLFRIEQEKMEYDRKNIDMANRIRLLEVELENHSH